MGLNSQFLNLLIQLKKNQHLGSGRRLIEIGAQQLHNTFLRAASEQRELGQLFGVSTQLKLPSPVETFIVHGSLEHLQSSAPYARDFYSWLGYEYAAVDIDGSPNSIPLDLNFDSVPKHDIGKYDIVTNLGTTEHVANQLNCFKIIHDFAAVNAVMIHELPAHGMLNHGLINYNPKFFWMLARSNGYAVVYADFSSDNVYYDLPENIRDWVGKYVDIGNRSPYRTADAVLLVVLKKVFDIPFVPPIDVPTGTAPPNKVLEERYWTVFRPNAFARRWLARFQS